MFEVPWRHVTFLLQNYMLVHHNRGNRPVTNRLLALLALCALRATAADFGWMQTARVFLIDAYEPPFATQPGVRRQGAGRNHGRR